MKILYTDELREGIFISMKEGSVPGIEGKVLIIGTKKKEEQTI